MNGKQNKKVAPQDRGHDRIYYQSRVSGNRQAQLRKINIAYTATSPYQAVLIVAKEVGLFKKHNLDPTLVFTTGGSLGIQAMLGGDVAMTLSDGSSSVGSKLAGVDVLVIASLLNTFPYSLISLPEIKKVDQLRGAKIAVSRFGSATDLSVKMALARLGLNAEKDVTLLTDRRADRALRRHGIEERPGDHHHAAIYPHRAQGRHEHVDRHGRIEHPVSIDRYVGVAAVSEKQSRYSLIGGPCVVRGHPLL